MIHSDLFMEQATDEEVLEGLKVGVSKVSLKLGKLLMLESDGSKLLFLFSPGHFTWKEL